MSGNQFQSYLHDEFERWRPDFQRLFPASVVKKLQDDFEIHEQNKQIEFRQFLEFATTQYVTSRDAQNSAVKPSSIRRELEQISKKAADLRISISNLSPHAQDLLWRLERVVDTQATLPEYKVSPYGHKITRTIVDEATFQIDFLKQTQIMEALEILEKMSAFQAKSAVVDKGGQPEDYALRLFVRNAQLFWTEKLERRFTYDAQGKEGITPAYRFCFDIISKLEPKIERSKLGTAMRKAIADQGKRTGKYRPRKLSK